MTDDRDAGRRALTEARWSDAVSAFENVLHRDPEDPEALEGLGIALYWREEAERAFELRERAYRIFVERDDRRAAVRVALGIVLDVVDYRGMAVANGWLQRSRRLLEGVARSPEHGWLALWEGHFARAMDHDLDRARALAEEAGEIARELKEGELELLSIALEGLVNVTAGNVREGMAQLDEATAAVVSGELSSMDAILATCCFLVHACERVGDWDRAAQWGSQMDALARRWRLGSAFAACQAEHAAMLVARGEWERAERDLLEALRSLEACRPLVVHEAIVQLAELRRRQGRLDEAAQLFNRCPTTTESIIGLAAIALARGDALRAAESLDRLRRRPMAEKWVQRALVLEILVSARLALDDRPAADAALAELRDIEQRVEIDMVRAITRLAEARLERDPLAARVRFEDALDVFERILAPWEAARTRLELAATLRQLGRASFAAEEEAAANDALRRLGVVPEEVKPSSPLTKRELEVLALVARGLSDKEVALHLKLSEHTIHRHVSNVLAKLELPSRAAAVAHASRQGWMADSGQ